MGIGAHRQAAVSSPLGEDVLLLVRMTGTEQLSRLFQFELDLFSLDGDIAIDDILGENMTVRLELQDGSTRYFNGYVSRFTQLGRNEEYYQYKATLRPWLWFLTRAADCRIFQEKTAKEIIEQVFSDHGFSGDVDWAPLEGEYPTWEYCVQYRETDFNFVSRLMEQVGLYYFFVHENGKHKLKIGDAIGAHEAVPGYETIPYFLPEEKDLEDRDCINEWTLTRQVQTGRYALNDFDMKVPTKELMSNAEVPRGHAMSEFQIYDYPGEFLKASEGEAYSTVRIQELQAQWEIVRAVSSARGVSVGSLFELEGHPRDDQNREHLVVSANHVIQSDEFRGSSSGAGDLYRNTFTAMDSQTPFRAPRITPKPVVHGAQTAIVVGPEGEEIWTDEHGRVKVQFHWDREGEANENSSRWIRVAQIWAGKGWGGIEIPRIGHEVVVEFLEGDADNPLITGCVYNGDNTPPWDLPDNQTQSGLKSNSSKGGDGYNMIKLEDKKGEEHIFVHAEKNQEIRVKNNRHETIGNDRHLTVKKKKFEIVEEDRSEEVLKTHKEKIGETRSLTVGGAQMVQIGDKLSVKVTGDVGEEFEANHHEATAGTLTLTADKIVLKAETNITLQVGGSYIALDSSTIDLETGGSNISMEAAKIEAASTEVEVAGDASVNVKSAATTVDGSATLDLTGGMVSIN